MLLNQCSPTYIGNFTKFNTFSFFIMHSKLLRGICKSITCILCFHLSFWLVLQMSQCFMCNARASVEINAEKRSTKVWEKEKKREERGREKKTPRKTNCQRIRIKSLIAVRFAHYVRGMQDRTFLLSHLFLPCAWRYAMHASNYKAKEHDSMWNVVVVLIVVSRTGGRRKDAISWPLHWYTSDADAA